MKCLCCNKELNIESVNGWHKECIKKFFKSEEMPSIDLFDNEEKLDEYGKKIISNNKSITGVQKKLSLHLEKDKDNRKYRLTLVGYPSGYILKPESNDFPYIARAEYLVMKMAEKCEIKIPMCALIKINKEKYGYIIKRMDRIDNNKIHMEDFCQLSEKQTENKYKGSYEKCAKIIDRYSSYSKLDKTELLYRLLFCFITGNSDMHLKNFSLMEEKNKNYLSNAYDLLPVNLLINDKDETALSLNGKNKNITRNDFIYFSESIGIEKKVTENLINNLYKKKDELIEMISQSLLPIDFQKEFIDLMNSRYLRLKKNIE